MSRAPDLSPREARDRWLDKMRVERSESSISSYHYRLKLFVEWAEDNGVESMRDLSGWDLERYETHRRSKHPALSTLKNELSTFKVWLEYLERIEAVEEGFAEKVEIPSVPPEERSSDVKLNQEAAADLLRHYRESSEEFGTRAHALLELAWNTGARAGSLVALDTRDLRTSDDGTRFVQFVNRPDTGTRLKKGQNGERPVLLPEASWDALDRYVSKYRRDVHDVYSREPLLASRDGRPSPGTIRDWLYLATIPCVHSPCPHNRDPTTCEYTRYEHASGCPSSRSPHQVRTGAITWMRNRGVPAEIVAERVNASVETIEEHYDKEDPVQEMLERRESYLTDLDITDHDTDVQ